jgi:predicted kinase
MCWVGLSTFGEEMLMILYILSGSPGLEKSTKAQQLADKHDAILLDRKDMKTIFRTTVDESHLTAVMAENARFLLESGYKVVIEDWAVDHSNEDLWYSIAEKACAVLQWVKSAED